MIRIAQFKPFFQFFLLVFLLVLTTNTLNAQGFMAQKDLSQFKAEMLSEADISKIKEKVQSQELTLDQLKAQATAKGMPIAEFEKLRIRLGTTDYTKSAFDAKNDKISEGRNNNVQSSDTSEKETKLNEQADLIFGAELFKKTGSFAANANIATPLNLNVK